VVDIAGSSIPGDISSNTANQAMKVERSVFKNGITERAQNVL
ncbi:29504_t:CDS:1, partial [Racocetra persica]